MQEKHKVTLYLPSDLHRQLKIRAAVDAEPMSAIAQRAIVFYLSHGNIVDEVESAYGHTHQVYSCPECDSAFVVREGGVITLRAEPGLLSDEELSLAKVKAEHSDQEQQDEQELVPC